MNGIGEVWIDVQCQRHPVTVGGGDERRTPYTQAYSYVATVVRASDGAVLYTTPQPKTTPGGAKAKAMEFVAIEGGRLVSRPVRQGDAAELLRPPVSQMTALDASVCLASGDFDEAAKRLGYALEGEKP